MSLSKENLEIIERYTDAERIDREKLISYLENHELIKNEVFDYCCKNSRPLLRRGYCYQLKNQSVYTPINRDHFIHRIPFFFYQMGKNDDRMSGLSRVIPQSNEISFDYEAFYCDLEWMFYELGLPLDVIFDYCRDQIAPQRSDERDVEPGKFVFSLPRNLFQEGRLEQGQLFTYWRHYLHLCADHGWNDFMPASLITTYNEVLRKVGAEPIIYYPVDDPETVLREGNTLTFTGHFPHDKNGRPIMEWTSIRVHNPVGITYDGKKSRCGDMCITIGPKTVVYTLESPDEVENGAVPEWLQVYAGPQTMEFDNEVLRECRKSKNMTQRMVADAIGTSIRTYQKWENGETTPDGHYLLRLMNWLEIYDTQILVKCVDLPEGGM